MLTFAFLAVLALQLALSELFPKADRINDKALQGLPFGSPFSLLSYIVFKIARFVYGCLHTDRTVYIIKNVNFFYISYRFLYGG